MLPATATLNEAERLEELRSLGILDTGPESAFDDLTLLAAQICETPIALITFVDERRQWFKSRVGLSMSETPRDQAFCAHAIHDSATMVVDDALADARFQNNPFVVGDPRIRFYAGVPIGLREGVNIGTLCVIDRAPRQLSETQKKALEALARQVRRTLMHRQFQYLVNAYVQHAAVFVAMKNEAGRFEFVNKAWRQALQRYGEPIGKTSAEWVDDPAAAEADLLDQQVARDQRANVSTVTPFGLADRTWIVERFPVLLLSGRNGVGIIGIDITERVAAEAKLRETERQLEHAARIQSLGMLASTVAHELNNILMGIGPNAELIARLSEEESRLRRASSAITEAVSRGRALIQQILRYGRPVEPLLANVDLVQWLQETLPLMRTIAGPSIEIEIDLAAQPLMIRGDRDQLHQIVANLITNARDAMNGGGRIHIALEKAAATEAHFVHLTVADSGQGVPPAILEKIFEPLFTTKRAGTGIGLAVVRQIIERHGGSITVESEVGRGTTFHIRLPVDGEQLLRA